MLLDGLVNTHQAVEYLLATVGGQVKPGVLLNSYGGGNAAHAYQFLAAHTLEQSLPVLHRIAGPAQGAEFFVDKTVSDLLVHLGNENHALFFIAGNVLPQQDEGLLAVLAGHDALEEVIGLLFL